MPRYLFYPSPSLNTYLTPVTAPALSWLHHWALPTCFHKRHWGLLLLLVNLLWGGSWGCVAYQCCVCLRMHTAWHEFISWQEEWTALTGDCQEEVREPFFGILLYRADKYNLIFYFNINKKKVFSITLILLWPEESYERVPAKLSYQKNICSHFFSKAVFPMLLS